MADSYLLVFLFFVSSSTCYCFTLCVIVNEGHPLMIPVVEIKVDFSTD